MRRVVCSALRAADDSLLLGIRHYSSDMHAQIKARSDGDKFKRLHGDDQGFVDQFGVYMTRREAWAVARKAGQIVRNNEGKLASEEDISETGELFSENLY